MSVNQASSERELDPGVVRLRQRLRALRGRYPGLAVSTDVTHIHEDQVVARASITFADGASISAHAAEPTDAGLLDEAIEHAEQRAMARAFDLLGVGDVPTETRRSEPGESTLSEPLPTVRAPEEATPAHIAALRKGFSPRAQSTVAPSSPDASPEQEEEPPPRDSEEPRQQTQADAPAPAAASSGETEIADSSEAEPDMADYSWTDFWTWARSHDLRAKKQVEQRIGRSIDGLTPQAVRQLLHEGGVPL